MCVCVFPDFPYGNLDNHLVNLPDSIGTIPETIIVVTFKNERMHRPLIMLPTAWSKLYLRNLNMWGRIDENK